jgi:predicted nucleotidyltransferase
MANRIPVIRTVLRGAYYLALSLLKKMCREHKIIHAVYVRNSFAEGEWVAGRSDIDLSVILKDGWEIDNEWKCLRNFKKDYLRLKRFFPMLGEVEYLLESHVDARCRYGYSGYQASGWKILYGQKQSLDIYEGKSDNLILDRLWQLLSTYVYLFGPHLKVKNWEKKDLCILSRIVEKTLKMSGLELQVNTNFKEPAEAQLAMICLLDIAVKAALREILLQDSEQPFQNKEKAFLEYQGEGGFSLSPDLCQSLLVIVQSKEYTYIVLKENCLTVKFIKAFDFLHKYTKPVFLTSALFQFYFAFCTPFKYISMLENRRVIFGEGCFRRLCQDVLTFSDRLSCNNLHSIVSNNAIYMFSDLYAQDWPNLSEQAYKDCLYAWYLKTLLFLETSRVFEDYEQMEKHCSEIDSKLGFLFQSTEPLRRFELARKICEKTALKLNDPAEEQKQKILLTDVVCPPF